MTESIRAPHRVRRQTHKNMPERSRGHRAKRAAQNRREQRSIRAALRG